MRGLSIPEKVGIFLVAGSLCALSGVLIYIAQRQTSLAQQDGAFYEGRFRNGVFVTSFPIRSIEPNLLNRGELWLAAFLGEGKNLRENRFSINYDDLVGESVVSEDWIRHHLRAVFELDLPETFRTIDSSGRETHESRSVEVLIQLPDKDFEKVFEQIDRNFESVARKELDRLRESDKEDFDAVRNPKWSTKNLRLQGISLESYYEFYVSYPHPEIDTSQIFFDESTARIFLKYRWFD